MGIEGWIAHNWFELLSSVGIIGGLWFTAVSVRAGTKAQRIANLLTLTENHRELLKPFYENAELTRIFNPTADIKSRPVSHGEEMYVNAKTQHLSSAYRAMQNDLAIRPEELRRDVRAFFALPIPKAVWEKLKLFQDADFVSFVEFSRTEG